MSDFTESARSSWITPDGGISVVEVSENHDYELPSIFYSVMDAEKVCIRISCSGGWNHPNCEIQLPSKMSISQLSTLSKLDEYVVNFRTISMFYWVNNSVYEVYYDDIVKYN